MTHTYIIDFISETYTGSTSLGLLGDVVIRSKLVVGLCKL